LKIVTQDYGCGTSSSILDYGIEDVVLVSPNNFEHVFDIEDDLFFVGHDFLFFLWDTQTKIDRWQQHKHRKAVWCFERINAIVPQWKAKSEYSISLLKQFIDQIYVCDEDDANIYGDWLPQWASRNFYDMRKDVTVTKRKALFSGQAGKPEYSIRTKLLNDIFLDNTLKNEFEITNFSRDLTWSDYCSNFLSYESVLNPVGILRGFNTRTYEVLYAGRNLLQQTVGKYDRHEALLAECSNVILFENITELKHKLQNQDLGAGNPDLFFEKNNLYARFKSIGVQIK
tara:strand:- start:806 stop:1660 length:855 start_codon:yes stop_codon:yes gene_type:complete